MYKVKREGGRISIVDWLGKEIYGVPDDYLVMYEDANGTHAAPIKNMDDQALLKALAHRVKIEL